MARRHGPALIVLDVDSAGPNAETTCDTLAERIGDELHPSGGNGAAHRQRDRSAHGQFVAKPYHYAPLILKIEEMLHGTGLLSRSA